MPQPGNPDDIAADWNDEFRRGLGMGVLPGTVVMSTGIAALGENAVAEILLRITGYDFVVEGNPSETRRLGVVQLPECEKVLWRIFCYHDAEMEREVIGCQPSDNRRLEIGVASEVCG